MNGKLKDLGLSETAHFTNSAGLYDEDHYCTVNDMAVILQAAVANDLCREVLSARTWQILLLSSIRKEFRSPTGFCDVSRTRTQVPG